MTDESKMMLGLVLTVMILAGGSWLTRRFTGLWPWELLAGAPRPPRLPSEE